MDDGSMADHSGPSHYGTLYDGRGVHGNNNGEGGRDVGGEDRGGGGGVDLWEESMLAGRGAGGSRQHHVGNLIGSAEGGRQDGRGWDDDILRNLDGLGDPIG